MLRAGLILLLAIGCGNKKAAEPAEVTREQCIAVRDRVVELITDHYIANGAETFDGLDRSDTATMVGIPPGVTRDTFGKWLASEAGKPWLANARARLVSGAGLSDTVERCVKQGRAEHIACWMSATTMAGFQRCPTPKP